MFVEKVSILTITSPSSATLMSLLLRSHSPTQDAAIPAYLTASWQFNINITNLTTAPISNCPPPTVHNVCPHDPNFPRHPRALALRLHQNNLEPSPRQRPHRAHREAQRLRDKRHPYKLRGFLGQSTPGRCGRCGGYEENAGAELQGHLESESAAQGDRDEWTEV